jgi:spore maturation protein SpmA
MNRIFFGIVALAVGFALWKDTPAAVSKAALEGAKDAVELALGLVGYIMLFLGLMKVVEEAGGLAFMARVIRPLLVRLFPDVPADHPAMGAIVMNIAANALGLGNAATPFGLKAMKELDTLNKDKGTATNAMVLFLAINTSGVALLPTGIIGLRDRLGSADPASIFPATLLATAFSTVVGVLAAKLLAGLSPVSPAQREADAEVRATRQKTTLLALVPFALFAGALVALIAFVHRYGEAASAWIMPALIFAMLAVGVARGVKVYEVFITGAKEGFALAVVIMPYLVAILMAVGMFRASGGLGALVESVGSLTAAVGLPGEVLPLALLRPLSGSGAFAITAELLKTHGADSYIGQLASTMNGSTETTFYVLAVYFGSVGVTRFRHAIPAGLIADVAGVVGSVVAVQLLLSWI